jgi:hypothetical protein
LRFQEALAIALEWGFQTAMLKLLPSFAALELNQQNPEAAFSLLAPCLDNPAAMAESREKARALFLQLPQEWQIDKNRLAKAKEQDLIPLMQGLLKS